MATCLLLGFAPFGIMAQISLQGGWWQPTSLGASDQAPEVVMQGAWNVMVGYAWRNRNMRLELQPSAGVIFSQAEHGTESDLFGTGVLGAVDARIYPMDLYGDCMCPTFNRNGDLFKKGFFWEAGLGYASLNQDLGAENYRTDLFLARAGLGLDIGLTRRLTLTPGARLQFVHGMHAWGDDAAQRAYRPIWVQPYLQLTTYLSD